MTYRSALGYVGTDSFTYSVGGVSATVTVTVAPVQIHLSTPADHPLTFDLLSLDPNAAGVLTARSALLVAASTKAGVVNAASAPATVALTGAPGHGSAAVDPSGTVTYTPSAGFTGQDSFPYRLVSGASPISVGTVGMKVVNPESPPAPSPATITPDVVGPPSPQAGGGPSVAVLGEQVVRDAPSSSRSPAPSPPSPAAAPSPPAAAAAPAPPDGGPVSDGRPPALIEQPAPSIAPVEAGRFFAVASRGRQASGPPGAGLDLGVTGYPSPCKTVYFFFDATRIGSAHPDANGDIVEKGLSVPGDTRPGAHTLSASCDPSRRTVLRSQPFSVDRVGLHRSSFVTSLPRPGRVPFSAKAIALSVAIAAGLMLLIAFPCELFNASLEEHYEEIRRWFRFKERALHSIGRRRQATAFVAFVAIGGGLYSMLDPRFGLNESSAGLALGMALGLIAVTFGFSVPVIIYMRRRHRDWGEVRVLPGGLVIAAACVLLSRLLHFQPGYLYGLIAGVAYHRELTRDTEGRITALSTLSMMALSLLAWLAWATLSQTAARSNPGLGLVVAETVLATVFAFGLETAVFGLLPLRFMAGSKIVAWNRWAWAAVFGLGLFGFVHILLRPGTGYVSTVGPGGVATVVGMLMGFGVLSVVLWGYFRFRPARQELAEEEFVGTAGVEL